MSYCINCGAPINDGAVFCERCGFNQINHNLGNYYQNNYQQPQQPVVVKEKGTNWVGIIGLIAVIIIGIFIILILKDIATGVQTTGDTTNIFNSETINNFIYPIKERVVELLA